MLQLKYLLPFKLAGECVCSVCDNFEDLVSRLYRGDSKAAEEIVRDFEPEIRRIVRSRLRDPRLRRTLDSIDICQSVFAKFFLQAGLGRLELNSPQDLVKLLTRMTTNKIIDKHRREDSQRRLIQNQNQANRATLRFGEPVVFTDPNSNLVYEELLKSAAGKLSENEMAISRLRNKGMTWLEVSRQLGESPQALRKRFERACNRVLQELGLE